MKGDYIVCVDCKGIWKWLYEGMQSDKIIARCPYCWSVSYRRYIAPKENKKQEKKEVKNGREIGGGHYVPPTK